MRKGDSRTFRGRPLVAISFDLTRGEYGAIETLSRNMDIMDLRIVTPDNRLQYRNDLCIMLSERSVTRSRT
jgi:hypothetical protein